MDIGVDGAARHAEFQRLEMQIAVVEHNMGGEIANRQARAVFNTTAFKAHIGIHHVPFVGFKGVVRQHFIARLRRFFAFFLLGIFALLRPGTGIDANQRAEVGKPQLARFQIPFQFRSRFALAVGQRAVNIALTDAPVKTAIIIDRAFVAVNFRHQPAVGFKRRRIGQQHTGQLIEIAQ
ncbi:hypothetical protein BN129_3053 [Cronobacter sakazakii 701]|nr:hypothetical protein BN129_3053 [Cronobacter sakazakii 701]